jgi:hypothetical protein
VSSLETGNHAKANKKVFPPETAGHFVPKTPQPVDSQILKKRTHPIKPRFQVKAIL